jgi:hypothetical protein
MKGITHIDAGRILNATKWRFMGTIPVFCFMALSQMGVPAQAALSKLKLLTGETTQIVFGDAGRPVPVTFQNTSDKVAEADVRIRLHQTSSATTILLSETPWIKLRVLPGQTVLEMATVNFPAVKSETTFLIQWVEGANQVLGNTEVLVYPTNLLAELKLLCGDEPLGVFDPQNLLKPLLKSAGVEISDLEEMTMEDFHGKLAILGPLQSKAQMREGFGERVRTTANKGVAVVWLQPPPGKRDLIKPSFYTVQQGGGAVVVVQANEVSNLAEDPQSQLNLIRFARLALHPEPLQLPLTSAEN